MEFQGGVTRVSEFSVQPGFRNPNSHGARPVHLIITMIKWIRTSRWSTKKSLSGFSVESGYRVAFHHGPGLALDGDRLACVVRQQKLLHKRFTVTSVIPSSTSNCIAILVAANDNKGYRVAFHDGPGVALDGNGLAYVVRQQNLLHTRFIITSVIPL